MDNRIVSLSPPFLHITGRSREALESELEEFGQNSKRQLIRVEGSRCSDYESLMQEFATAFRFPDYFGSNWDALDECINDLDWLPGDSYIVVIYNIESVLSKDFAELPTFYRLLVIAIDEWTSGRNTDDFPTPPTPFHVILHSSNDQLGTIRKKLEMFGIGIAECDII